jgi:GAF domain-containing protein
MGCSQVPHKLIGEIYNQDKMLPIHFANNAHSTIIALYCFNFTISYFFEEYDAAFDYAQKAQESLDSSIISVNILGLYFYQSLVYLAQLTNNKSWKRKYLKRVEINQRKIKKALPSSSTNFLHKYNLVEAEKYRVLGKYQQAIDYYDRAILGAKENEYIQEEALANELAGKFYWARKNYTVAKAYLQEARYCYLKWGAKAKVEQLDQKYPQFLRLVSNNKYKKSISANTTSENINEQLDLATVIKTSKTLSQEANLENLLKLLIEFLVENTGAQTGLIFLENEGSLQLKTNYQIEKPKNNHKIKLPETIINYVQRTQEIIVLDNASETKIFYQDKYIQTHQTKSVLCLPLLSQAKFIGILYLGNNLSDSVFNEDRLEVVKLLSNQAAIAIENALLKQQESSQNYEYQVGGCLAPNSPTYVVRQADKDLYQAIKKGEFCYILNSRHMGKSSLRVQIMQQLEQEGYVCAAIDLTAIGSSNITEEQWYAGLIYKLVNSFQLTDKFDLRDWWKSLDFLSPVQRLSEFILQVLLKKIKAKIAIFIDEIDSILSLKFATDNFFAAVRSCYNSRADNSEYTRISVVFLGVASPSELVQDKQRTPFNIGVAISLENFKLNEIKPLAKGLVSKYSQPEILLQEVLTWTNGQPFLTQKICSLIIKSQTPINAGKETEWVANLVTKEIIENWEAKDEPQHLKTIRDWLCHCLKTDRLLQDQQSTPLLELYQQILDTGEIMIDHSSEQRKLLLSGLVIVQQGKLKIYNSIYHAVFNQNWLTAISR